MRFPMILICTISITLSSKHPNLKIVKASKQNIWLLESLRNYHLFPLISRHHVFLKISTFNQIQMLFWVINSIRSCRTYKLQMYKVKAISGLKSKPQITSKYRFRHQIMSRIRKAGNLRSNLLSCKRNRP